MYVALKAQNIHFLFNFMLQLPTLLCEHSTVNQRLN